MVSIKHYVITIALTGLFLAVLVIWPDAQAESKKDRSGPMTSEFSGDPNQPRRHFRVRDISEMTPDERQKNYQKIRNALRAGYAASGGKTAQNYQKWPRINTAPYRSATHGRRFVNNYVNSKGAAYAMAEESGTLPVGTIIAKDSFVAAKDGSVMPGPLFLMEKMTQGFNYVSGDWRYTMVMPDGSVFGATKGANAARVEFCIGCHLAREKYDHLFYVPKKYRKR